MRVGRERLVFLALVALDEVIEVDCQMGPAQPTALLRTALALLAEIGTTERHWFDEFWRQCQHENVADHPTKSAYARTTMARSAWNAIARGCGHEPTAEFRERVAAARGRAREMQARAKAVELLGRAAHERIQASDDKRRYYWRPPPRDG